MRKHGSWVCVVAVLGATRAVRADDKALAETMFQEGRKLLATGKLAEACARFEASYKAEPAMGTLLNLGECHEKLGRTATAWAEFHEAMEMAHLRGDTREAAVQKRAAALEPRLNRVRINPPAADIPGMVVARDGSDATASLGVEMPVDPGEHRIEVSAPGYHPWTFKLTVKGDGAVATVDIPSLTPVAPPPAPAVAPPPEPAPPAGRGTAAERAASARANADLQARRAADQAREAAANAQRTATAIARAQEDWQQAEAAALRASAAAKTATELAITRARTLRALLFRSWTPPRAEATGQVKRWAVDARIAALYGRCADTQSLAASVEGADRAYYGAVLAPDPLIAYCKDR